MTGARELALAELPALHSTVERLAARAGVARPKLYVLADGHPRPTANARDVLVHTIAVVLAATLIELSRIGGVLERALLFVLGPLASAFVHLLLSPKREFAADRVAARLCDSPHGLADALIRLEQASELVDFSASPATRPLYTAVSYTHLTLPTTPYV